MLELEHRETAAAKQRYCVLYCVFIASNCVYLIACKAGRLVVDYRGRTEMTSHMSALSFKAFCIENYAQHIGRSSNKGYDLFAREKLLNLLGNLFEQEMFGRT